MYVVTHLLRFICQQQVQTLQVLFFLLVENDLERDKICRLCRIDQLIESTFVAITPQCLLFISNRFRQPHQFKHFFLRINPYFLSHFLSLNFLQFPSLLYAQHLPIEHLFVVRSKPFGMAEKF